MSNLRVGTFLAYVIGVSLTFLLYDCGVGRVSYKSAVSLNDTRLLFFFVDLVEDFYHSKSAPSLDPLSD